MQTKVIFDQSLFLYVFFMNFITFSFVLRQNFVI